MTNFDRVKGYYRVFDEKNRLVNSGSGKLEYMMSMDLLKHWLPENGKILDLGGGAGAYSFPLAAEGYKVTLADLSEELIRQAEEQNEQTDYPVTCNVVNAVDLSQYHDREFDAVLLMGPLYHLLEKSERDQCIAEVNRVLKPGGIVFATFLPYLTGSIGVVDRFFGHPEQVNAETIREVFRSGRFNNLANAGFQEGYYPTSEEIEELFRSHGFDKQQIRSIRVVHFANREKLSSRASNTTNADALPITVIAAPPVASSSADPSLANTAWHPAARTSRTSSGVWHTYRIPGENALPSKNRRAL